MIIANPWECSHHGDDDADDVDHTGSQHGRMVQTVMAEDVNHVGNEPDQSTRCATRMDTSKMLENRRATETEPERSTLEKMET